MKPNKKLISISDNEEKIIDFLNDLVLQPRMKAIKWSHITKQTPNVKIGYPAQHFASLITGMEGERTGARGNDLIDGSEVKACSRIDQLDKCLSCKGPVARLEGVCPSCGSENIKRNNDSKWLFTIRSKADLEVLTRGVGRVILIIGDYPEFDENNFDKLRFQSFEIWPESKRQLMFAEIMTNYYEKIFLEHKKLSRNKTPAPKNFWPYSFQFYMCNPIKTFECIVENASSNPLITINHYVKPDEDRSSISSEVMPTEVLSKDELDSLYESTELYSTNISDAMYVKDEKASLSDSDRFSEGIDEGMRKFLDLRDTDKIATANSLYSRRKN